MAVEVFIVLRALLIYLSKAAWARRMVTHWGFARRTAARFVAGEKLADAIQVVKDLNARGINATLDLLGEHTTSPEIACRATQDVLEMLETIERTGVRSNVSIKLTQIGLALDETLCTHNLQRIVACARKYGNFVRIDMEDSPWVAATLRLYHQVRQECACDNLGVVIQSYLYRSDADVDALVVAQAKVRLCKGAYQEPPELAYPKKADVDASYDRLAARLVHGALAAGSPPASADGVIPPIPAFATHDDKRIDFARAYARQGGLPATALEFQMLYGIRRDLQEQLVAAGYPVRVYVPFGAEWYPYFTRRLAERPANLWFFLSNLFR